MEQNEEEVRIRQLAKVTKFLKEHSDIPHYKHMALPPEEFLNWKTDKKQKIPYSRWIMNQSNCPTLKMQLDVPYYQMAKEAEQFLGEYVKHRGDINPGWSSIVVHGQGWDKTQPDDFYVNEGAWKEGEGPEFGWTEIADKCPVTVNWLKNVWPFKKYNRVRYMLLEPGGFISPHLDYKERNLAAFNVALSNPPGVKFCMEDAGMVPWEVGDARAIDIGRLHSVHNTGTENRIHMIIHGHWGDNFENVLCESFDQLLAEIKD